MSEQLARPVAGISIAQLLRDIKEGETKPFDKKYTNYLRSKSSQLRHEFPERTYSVAELENKTEVSWRSKH
jgi:hypothetical protein